MRKKTFFGDPNFVSGDLFTGMSRQKATWQKMQLGALTVPKSIPSRQTCNKRSLSSAQLLVLGG